MLVDNPEKTFRNSKNSFEVTETFETAFKAAGLAELIAISVFRTPIKSRAKLVIAYICS